MRDAAEVLDSTRASDAQPRKSARSEARRQLFYELVSGLSGLALAVCMWGHMFFVGSILIGTRGFDWIATAMEEYWIAQPTVIAVLLLLVRLHLRRAALVGPGVPDLRNGARPTRERRGVPPVAPSR